MTAAPPRAVIGVDAGGTKTAAALVAAEDGTVLARARSGPANYQAVGRSVAATSLHSALAPLLQTAAEQGRNVAAVAWGLSGLDRPKDAATFDKILDNIHPAEADRVVVNDTWLILRAGTRDGVGVAVVSGTGSNCVGTGPSGAHARIGGLGHPLGDFGSGGDIGREALGAAFRGADGRAPATVLTQRLMARYHLDRLDDLVDWTLVDAPEPLLEKNIAPLVLDAARDGDPVARRILEDAGRELGLCARLVGARLFPAGAAFPVVLGGSILQRGRSPFMLAALEAELHSAFPAAHTVLLDAPPVLGAVLLALDALAARAAPVPFQDALAAALSVGTDGEADEAPAEVTPG